MKKLLVSGLFLILCMGLYSCHHHKALTGSKRTRYMRHAFKGLKSELTQANVTMMGDSIKVIFPEYVVFDFGSATIKPQAYPSFMEFAKLLQKYYETNIIISGFTDSVGTQQYNEELSKNRADSAKNLLHHFHVAGERMATWGLGPKQPIASNATEDGRMRNRRVEFAVLYDFREENVSDDKK